MTIEELQADRDRRIDRHSLLVQLEILEILEIQKKIDRKEFLSRPTVNHHGDKPRGFLAEES